MFSSASKLVGEAIGTSDNCAVIPRARIRQESIYNQFLLTNEEVYVLLKSVKREYFFTERAFIIVHGEAAVGTKRLVERFEYTENPVHSLQFETAGMGVTDLDCELKFAVGSRGFSVDVKKHEAANAAAVYRLLAELAAAQQRNIKRLRLAESAFGRSRIVNENSSSNDFETIEAMLSRYNPVSYKALLDAAYAEQFKV